MAYADKAAMLERYDDRDLQALTDRDNSGAIDDAKLATALDDASAEIDSYLQKRFSLPLANPPHSLTVICCRIAYFNLQTLRGRATEDARKLYQTQKDWLERVQEGETGLGDDTPGDGEASSPGAPMLGGKAECDRVFSDDALESY